MAELCQDGDDQGEGGLALGDRGPPPPQEVSWEDHQVDEEDWEGEILQYLDHYLECERGEERVPPGAPPMIPATLLGLGETCGGAKRKLEMNWLEVIGMRSTSKRPCLEGQLHLKSWRGFQTYRFEMGEGLGVGYRSRKLIIKVEVREIGTQTDLPDAPLPPAPVVPASMTLPVPMTH